MAVDQFVERLLKIDSCAVSDSLDKLGIKGVALGIHPVSVSRRVAGRAVTVQLEPAEGRTSVRHLCTAAVDASREGDVIVIANGNRTEASGWGGILSQGAVVHGVVGIVTDGGVRDVDESRDLGLPVFASGVVPWTARGRVVETEWNVPVPFSNGLTVTPGDYVIADGSGVVIIPQDKIEAVVSTAEDIAARERAMSDAVRAGAKLAEIMGKSYEELLSTR